MGTINNVNIQVSLTEINRVSAAIEVLYNRLESLSKSNDACSESAKKASKDTKKLSESFAAICKAAKKAFDAIKEAGKELWDSIESSFDYVEASNYFQAVLGQMAGNADLSSFQEMGYASADAYYDSFAQRAEALTAKMSGFTVGENGLLQAAGGMSLGLDPSQIMNYQAVFGQISSSLGMSGETALKLSQALTEIGADLASVKNMDFDKVWEDMASGLAGTSSALDKYGANIRDASLQQKLAELGINANIEALDQNDKALLRAVVLLDSTRHAWGNLADSIDQPTNQLRLIQSNFENLSRMIGSLFLPTVSTVLPYVNAFAIALQRLLSWLGSLAGIDISGINDMAEGADLSGILDQADKLEDGLSGAKEEADKLNKSVRQFDELKVISAQDAPAIAEGLESTGGTGLLDAAFNNTLSEYQKEWDGAFAGIENRAQEIADSFEKAFEPVKKLVQDLSIGDFFQAGKDTSAIVVGITDFIADAIDSVDWYGIGQKIGDYLAGIDWLAAFKSVGNLVWQALKAAFELYFGVFSSAPLETAVISLAAMPGHLKAVTASAFVTGFKNLADKAKLVSTSFMGNKDNTKLLMDQYPKLGKAVDVVKDSFWALKTGIADKNFGSGLNLAIENIRNHLTGLQKAGITAIAGFGEFTIISKTFEGLTLGTENLLGGIAKIGGVAATAAGAMYTALGPAGLAIAAITGVVAAIEGIKEAQLEALEVLDRTQELEVFGDSVSNLTSKWEESAQAIRDRIEVSKDYIQTSGLAEANMAQDLSDKYFELAEKQNRTNEETEEMKGLAKLLVQTLPDLEKFYNTETGLIDAKRESIDKFIDSRLKEIRLSAIEDELTQIYKNRVSTMFELEKASQAVYAAQEKMQNLKSSYSEQEYILELLGEYNALPEKIIKSLETSREQYIYMYTSSTEGLSEKTKGLIERQKELETLLTNNGENIIPSYSQIVGEMGNISKKMKLFEEDYAGIMREFSGFEEAYKDQEGYISELSTMWSGIAKSETGASEYTSKVYEYVSGASKIAKEAGYGTGYEYIEEIKNGVEDAMKMVDISETAKKYGEDADKGFEKGIYDNSKSIIVAVSDTVGAAMKTWQETQLSNSPSKITQGFGKDAVDGYILGVESKENSTLNVISGYINNVLGKFREMIDPLQQIGVYSIQGLINGLSSMESSLYSKTGNIANNIAQTIKIALEIHSPSRVMFELGDYTMQGFQDGLESTYNSISQSLRVFSTDLQGNPPLSMDNYQISSSPSFADMHYGYREKAGRYMVKNENFGGDGGLGEREIYNIAYDAISAAIANSKLLNDQKDMVEGILKKPIVGSEALYKDFVNISLERGGNINGGYLNRLAVAQELYSK